MRFGRATGIVADKKSCRTQCVTGRATEECASAHVGVIIDALNDRFVLLMLAKNRYRASSLAQR